MTSGCVFCDIATHRASASIVHEDALTMAFIDLRQFHAGHTLIIPRRHLADIRELDRETGAALMVTMARVSRAVSAEFPNQGLSLWHSVGEAAFQEVPHLHFHVHPRLLGDQVLRVYPKAPTTPQRNVLEQHAERLRRRLERDFPQV